MQEDKSFVVIDIETTGLNSNPDYGEVNHIIEVGAVKSNREKSRENLARFVPALYLCPKESKN